MCFLVPQVRDGLLKNIKRRMTPQPVKIRADVELTCFQYDGIEHIKTAIRAAEAQGTEVRLIETPECRHACCLLLCAWSMFWCVVLYAADWVLARICLQSVHRLLA